MAGPETTKPTSPGAGDPVSAGLVNRDTPTTWPADSRPVDSRPRRPSDSHIHQGVCEFGERMAQLLRDIPHAWGAVLSDGTGEPIDAARRVECIEEIDIQIAGAQLGQCLARTRTTSTIMGLGEFTMIAEADHGLVLARPLLDEYLFTLVTGGAVSLRRAMIAFERCCEDLIEFM